ncbi:MAG: phosphate ABC transporter ATP-binding protein [Elusimicrobia bacterium]|nr:phosphate ABC transporter ATP-binding protein [Elusimicrobiota bacterium]
MTGQKGLQIEELSIRADGRDLLRSVSLEVRPGEILGIIGPAGSGKTTLLRCLNRLADLDEGLRISGRVFLNGASILGRDADVVGIRRKIGLVFPVPTPLPLSIFDNLAFGPRIGGITAVEELRRMMESSLKSAYLWEEVNDRLNEPAANLSGGQQQRLCLARTLMLEPEILLLDEPCSGLDPISTAQIEEALKVLRKDMAIVLVTNNVKQASRVADKTAFLLLGELVEFAPTRELFTTPRDKRTEDYITGRFG